MAERFSIQWSGQLSRLASILSEHRDIRFYGLTLWWVGLGVIVGFRKATPTPETE